MRVRKKSYRLPPLCLCLPDPRPTLLCLTRLLEPKMPGFRRASLLSRSRERPVSLREAG